MIWGTESLYKRGKDQQGEEDVVADSKSREWWGSWEGQPTSREKTLNREKVRLSHRQSGLAGPL